MAIQDFVAAQELTATQMDALQANDYNWTVTVKTASYVLVAADKGTRIAQNVGSANTVTVNTSLFTAGDIVAIHNIGAGAVTITAGSATVTSAGSLVVNQWGGGHLYFTSASAAIWFPSAGAGTTSRIWLHTDNGAGGTDTAIRRYTTTVANVGSDITYADSAANGSTFTVNTAGMYAIVVQWAGPTADTAQMGLSLNSAQLTTDIPTITTSTRLAMCRSFNVSAQYSTLQASSTWYFAVNDVIRPHGVVGHTPTTAAQCSFQIVRVN